MFLEFLHICIIYIFLNNLQLMALMVYYNHIYLKNFAKISHYDLAAMLFFSQVFLALCLTTALLSFWHIISLLEFVSNFLPSHYQWVMEDI